MKWQRLLRMKNGPDGEAAAGKGSLPSGDSQFVFDACLLSDVGCTRTNNEDTGRIVHGSGSDRSNRMLVVVADGMGGHNAGEIASATAISVIEGAYAQMRSEPAEQLKEALEAANSTIHRKSIHDSTTQGMGTTCTALLLQDGWAYSAHVGDSRIYLIRRDAIYLMSEDHSAVMELVKRGELTLQEARHHPDKNVVTRCLGTRPQVEVSAWPEPLLLQAGDHFLLCSDGLHDQVEDNEICAIVRPRSAADACEELIRLAKERGAPDNVTVAVIELQPSAPASKASRVTRQIEVHP
ncbi:MAG TPA: Stp1/IreP family PP2C-type Ser/Thr phosphatase [Terracidiphilus sp.]|nr:Stp1/IreP family PP2C-type Ser/Thr phosphatase [Terracidiphilus sp.]